MWPLELSIAVIWMVEYYMVSQGTAANTDIRSFLIKECPKKVALQPV